MKGKGKENALPVRRMVAAEQKEFINLLGIISQLAYLDDGLGRRMEKIPKANFRFKGALANLVRLSNDLTLSIPEEQREHFQRQLPAIHTITGTTAQLPRNNDSFYGRWLSFEQLDVVTAAIRECCLTCNKSDPQEQKQCIFCKLLEVLPTDKPDENATGCGYFSIW